MFTDPKVISYFTNEMILAKVNGDIDTVTARKYNVSGYPTSVILGPDGREIDRIVGYAPPKEYLRTVIDYRMGVGTLDDLLAQAQKPTGPRAPEIYGDLERGWYRRSRVEAPRKLYFDIADKYKYRGGSADAEVWYRKVIESGKPTDDLSGESRMALADMQRRAKNYDGAISSFQSIMTDFKGTPFAEGAEIWTAIVYARKGDTAQAIMAYEKFIEHYPKSEDIGYAQKQIEKLKNPPKPKEESGT